VFNVEWTREKGSEGLYRWGILALAAIGVLMVAFLVGTVFARGYSAISLEFLFSMPKNRGVEGGIFPALYGTLYLLFLTASFSVPVGILAAVYLTEYAKHGRLLSMVNTAILNLAGVPSIVYGLFGLSFFVLFLHLGSSLLAASLTLACMTLPVVVTAAREALLAVPESYREASWALGATKWQTIRSVVLPAAKGGIITGGVLGIARAAGETAPILATGVAFVLPRLPISPTDRFMALPYQIYIYATQIPDMPKERMWGAALVLLVIVLCANTVAAFLRAEQRVKEGTKRGSNGGA
jgi:phosphate transport system permease protein